MRNALIGIATVLAASGLACGQAAQPAGEQARSAAAGSPASLDTASLESPLLADPVQITSRDKFLKAGEAYFDHQFPVRWVIFQAVPVPEKGKEPDSFYSMYIAKLKRNDAGRIIGVEEPVRISTPGSAATCGWFHPTDPGRLLMGMTTGAPDQKEPSGYQRGSGRYRWDFPSNMRVFTVLSKALRDDYTSGASAPPEPTGPLDQPVQIDIPADGYTAECSYSRDGRVILYAKMIEPSTKNVDIYCYDTKTKQERVLVKDAGYDGGPFFSMDGRRICYRSDRKGNDLLQVFVADLILDSEGVPVGVERELPITDDENVNWGPFWHPTGKYLVYGTSSVGHDNYEIFASEVPPIQAARRDGAPPNPAPGPAGLKKRRVTFSPGADVLPVFSDDGLNMIWTAQRGPMVQGESKPSSQVWISPVAKKPGGFMDFDHLFTSLPEQKPESAPAPEKK